MRQLLLAALTLLTACSPAPRAELDHLAGAVWLRGPEKHAPVRLVDAAGRTLLLGRSDEAAAYGLTRRPEARWVEASLRGVRLRAPALDASAPQILLSPLTTLLVHSGRSRPEFRAWLGFDPVTTPPRGRHRVLLDAFALLAAEFELRPAELLAAVVLDAEDGALDGRCGGLPMELVDEHTMGRDLATAVEVLLLHRGEDLKHHARWLDRLARGLPPRR